MCNAVQTHTEKGRAAFTTHPPPPKKKQSSNVQSHALLTEGTEKPLFTSPRDLGSSPASSRALQHCLGQHQGGLATPEPSPWAPLDSQGGTSSSRLPFQAKWQRWELSISFRMLPETFLHPQGRGGSWSKAGAAQQVGLHMSSLLRCLCPAGLCMAAGQGKRVTSLATARCRRI